MLGLLNNNLAKITTIITLFSTQVSFAYEGWNYQPRGDRWEGIAPRPVSGLDIELLSALVDYRENRESKSNPSYCKLKFYLPHATQVDLRVQELRPEEFYKMDRVKRPWRKHDFNDYQWTTNVIQGLGLNIPQLGVLARLKKRGYNSFCKHYF